MKISVSEINPRKPDSKRNENPKHMKAQRKLTSPNHETRLINPMNAITTIPAVLRGSARKIVSSLALALLAGVAMLVPSASAQTVAYTANVNTTADYFNNDSLNMGHIFTVSGAGIEVIQLGYFDFQNHPLTYSHAVTLFSNETAIATVTIPAGSVAPLLDGFAFEPLSTPIYLPPGQYTVLAYGIDDNDPNGEGANIGFNGSANLSVVNACYDWTTQGSPDYPGGPGDAPYNGYSLSWDNNTATASFTYANGIEVLAPPVVNPPVVSGGNLILTGSGGIADAGYTLLTTTNLAIPISAWTTNATGTFNGSGAFSNSIPISQSQAAQFFLLRTP